MRLRHMIMTLLALSLAACTGAPAAAPTAEASAVDPNLDDWDSVLATARGQTVNWYLWGGSDSINTFVDAFYGKDLKERYGITLNRVPVADTVDAVNQVLSEKQANVDPGAVDLIWINGENFYTLRQADLLYGGWSRRLPNSALVNWDNPALNLDFGHPVETYESPWSSAQFQFVYDSERLTAADLPRSYADLKAWACAHPGRFTYIAPGPGGYLGTRFVKGALYELSGGPAAWQTYAPATWERWAPKLWDYLNELEPCLWRQGETYPKDEAELKSLFANREVDFSMTNDFTGAGTGIQAGLLPATARAFVFDANMIGDFNYVAIPANAPHKAAALVLANLLLDPEFQAAQILPENGFGLGYAIDVTRVSQSAAIEHLKTSATRLGNSATPAADLARSLVGDTAAEYQNLVEQGWLAEVVQK